jgi:hypothetical protein
MEIVGRNNPKRANRKEVQRLNNEKLIEINYPVKGITTNST